MVLTDLRLENLRSFEQATIELDRGWNIFVGGNGAGKTTILEAVYLLSHGRSFRAHAREAMRRRGAKTLSVSALTTKAGADTAQRAALGFTDRTLEARLGGARVVAAELMRQVAVVCFEPGSHSIILGAADERRRFIDWGMFHVEPLFLDVWRRYNRALKQRNAALRSSCTDAELDVWDHELVVAATPLIEMRSDYADRFAQFAARELAGVLSQLGPAKVRFYVGQRADMSLEIAVRDRRLRDRMIGYTTVGPHRADWSIGFEQAPTHHYLSRGQAKLAAFACVMAQVEMHRREQAQNPVVCLDDLASELDAAHLGIVMHRVAMLDAQILVTSNDKFFAENASKVQPVLFHVEPGQVKKML